MAKITEFNQDLQYYYDIAMEKSDDGDFVGCIEYLEKARTFCESQNSEDDLELRLEIADTYSNMGLFDLSNKEYFYLTKFADCTYECYFGIIKNFIIDEKPNEAMYYIKQGLEKGILDPESGFEDLDFTKDIKKNSFKLLKNNDDEYLLSIAKQFIATCDYRHARQILEKISQTDKNYCELNNTLAMLEISEFRVHEGIEYCEKVLSKDSQNTMALTTKILAYSMIKNTKKLEPAIKQLDDLDIKEYPQVGKIALTMAQADNDELTVKYAKRSLQFSPYDKEISTILALALRNLGKYALAKQEFLKSNTIYKDDYFILENLRELSKVGVKNFSGKKEEIVLKKVLLDVDFSASKSRRILQEFISKLTSKSEFTKYVQAQKKTDKNFIAKFKWVLRHAELNTVSEMLKFIGSQKFCKEIVSEYLVDPNYSNVYKKILLKGMLLNASSKESFVKILVNNQLREVECKIKKIAERDETFDAYNNVLVTTIFLQNSVDTSVLRSEYSKLCLAFLETDYKVSSNVISAVLAKNSMLNKMFYKKTDCCEIFGCTEKEFNEFNTWLNEKLDYYESIAKKNREIRRSTKSKNTNTNYKGYKG